MSNNDFVVKHGLTVLQGGVVINEGGLTVTGGDITLPEILRIGSASGADRFPNTMVSISNTTAVDKPNRLHNTGLLAEGTSDAVNTTHYGVGVYGIGYVNDATFAAGVTGEGQISDIMDSGMATGVRGFSVEEHDGINIGVLAMAMAGTSNYALYMPAGNIYTGDAQSWELHGALTFSGEYDVTIPQLVGTKTDVTTINNITLTKPSSSATLTIANEKSLTVNNSITFTATDASSISLGAGGTVIYASDKLSALSSTTSAELAGVISDETGTGALVFAESPTLVTPALGVATATSINKVTITEPASSATLTIADSFTTSGAFPVTLTATDTTALTLPVDGTVLSSTSTVFNKVTITAPTDSATLTIADGKTLTVSNSVTFTATDESSIALGAGGTVIYASDKLSALSATTSAELAGVISDETGTGVLVFSETPTLVTPSVTTSITTGSTSFDLLDTSATTINFGGEATVVNIGSGSPGLTTINHDLQVAGSITFSAGATSLSSTVINVDDPLLYLAANNPADIMDLGILGGYDNGVHLHTGLIRDASDKVWKLISGLSDEPDQILNTVDFTNATYDDLKIGGLLATTVNKVTITAPTNSATLAIADGKAITTADSFTTSGAFPITLTATASTGITLPTSGTLLTDGSTVFNKVTITAPDNSATITIADGKAITTADSFTTAGAFPITLTATASTGITLPTSGTLLTDGSTVFNKVTITAPANSATITIADGKAITTADSFTTVGAYPITLTATASTGITLPTSGTLLTDGSTVFNKVTITAPANSATLAIADGKAITTADSFTTVGAFPITLTATEATTITLPASGNLVVDGYTTTETAAATTDLTKTSTPTQVFTGTTTQIVNLPNTSELHTGEVFTIINKSTGSLTIQDTQSTAIATQAPNTTATYTVADTAAQTWVRSVTPMLNSGASLSIPDNKSITTADSFTTAGAFPITLTATEATTVTLPASGNLVVDGYATTATAAGTTTLTKTSASTQIFTGVTTQTILLPSTADLYIGKRFTITNKSTGSLSVQDSTGTAILTQTTKTTATYIVSDTASQTWESWQTSTDAAGGGSGITDSTGTGTVVMYNVSPTIKTSLVTHADSTSFDLINTVATTVNFAGAGTAISIGSNAISTTTYLKNSTVVFGNTNATASAITTPATTFSLINDTATTVNFAGAGTAISIGSNAISTNTYLKNSTVVFGNTNATASAITTPATTFNLINDTATTVNFAGEAANLNMGATNSTTTIGGSLAVTGGITVNGGVTLVNTSTVNVADPMLRMASGNTVDTVDIGILGKYNTTKFTGFVRDASDGIWKLFNELVPVDGNGQPTDPGTTLDFSQVALGYAPIKVGALTAASFNKVSITAPTDGATLAIANNKAITTADSFTTVGAFPITLTATANTSVTLPTSGALVADGYTTTATAAGTTALAASSTSMQVFTGTTTQTVTLPSTSGLTLGRRFTIVNSSTGNLTIQDSTAGALATQGPNTSATYTVAATGTQSWVHSITAKLNSGSTISIPTNKSITTADSFTTAGAFPVTLTATADTSVTLPTGGTLVTSTTPTITGLKETKGAMAANEINLALGNYFAKTITAISTLSITNVAATGSVSSFILDLTNGGAFSITWWAGVKWVSATAPTLTASGRDVLGFFTHDGGSTWTGLVLSKDLR